MTTTATFDPSRCVVFDLECYPGRWCVGFHGIDHNGQLSTKVVETKNDLVGLLMHFAKQRPGALGSDRFRISCGDNSKSV